MKLEQAGVVPRIKYSESRRAICPLYRLRAMTLVQKTTNYYRIIEDNQEYGPVFSHFYF
ncbi:hypothetical protein D3C74_138810 [compost metagenome]